MHKHKYVIIYTHIHIYMCISICMYTSHIYAHRHIYVHNIYIDVHILIFEQEIEMSRQLPGQDQLLEDFNQLTRDRKWKIVYFDMYV